MRFSGDLLGLHSLDIDVFIHLLMIKVTVSFWYDSRVAWSPRIDVILPSILTVETAGLLSGANAWR